MGLQLRLVLSAFIVYFGLVSVQLHDQMADHEFDTMKEELQLAHNMNRKKIFLERSESKKNIVANKRETDQENEAPRAKRKAGLEDDDDLLGDEDNFDKDFGKNEFEVNDYADLPENESISYEQLTDADIFYEDAVRHALQLLWKHRFYITRANFHLIDVLGRNAIKTIKFRDELNAVRDIIDRKRVELWNKLEKKSTLNEMTSAPIIEQSILDKLTDTWKSLTTVFDVHQPQNRTLEFSETYKWMQNADNNTSGAYKRVNWIMAKIKKMRPVNQ